jgi:hypothetical protein
MLTLHPHPSSWTAERDEVFFRIVVGLFAADFLEAASVLLASYDDAAVLDLVPALVLARR